ncbi:MAG: PEP-CTERM sorting domain-containing protein [Azonexaceae bacterium]|nr:PEP-CTERM sorting domain-containing protein [Azonexaceae bacterium]
MKKLLAIAALLSAPALAQANLVVNGSFEDYTSVTPGHWDVFYGAGYGWTTGANGVEIRNAIAGTAAEGVRFAELDAYGNSWISQTIHTNPFQSLELSFFYAPRAGVSEDSNGIRVYWNNQSVGSIKLSGINSSDWGEHFYDLKADANGFGVLKFAAIGTSDSFGGSLDNITVTAVPEPGSASMLLAGLGILAAVVRRRRA